MIYVLSVEKILKGLWKMSNCNLTTCRYNADGKCTNQEKREECLNVARAVLCMEGEKTYTTDVLPTTEPLKTIRVSILYKGTKETKWIDCTYNTNILLSFPMQVHGYFSYKGDKINIKRVLKWKYR